MITKEQALTERYFHVGCTASVGPRGGVAHHPIVWRRNGVTQTWKTRPDHFRVPVKYGIKYTGQLTHHEAYLACTEAECEVCRLVYALRNEPETLRRRLASLTAS